MQRKFLTNLGLLLFLNFLVKPFYIFGIDRTVQNMVGAENFGLYFAVFNFSFLFNILLDFGITSFNNRNISQHNHLLSKHFSSILVLKLLLGLVFTVVVFAVALVIGYRLQQLHFLLFMAINQFLISMILYLRSNISGLMLFRTDSVVSVLDRLIMIGICAVLLWGNVTGEPFRIMWFVYAQTAAYLITALIALLIVVRKAAFRQLSWNMPFFMMIIRRSFPYAILILLMTFYTRLDSVMLERLLPGDTGKQHSGIYAHAYRLLDAANMFAYLFAVLLLPIFSRMLKLKTPVVQMLKLSFTLLITIAIIISVGSFFYSYPLMQLLYVDHVGISARVFRMLILGFVPITVTYVFGTLLTANGNLRELNLMSAVAIVINIVLNLVLIPRYQALGSAWASLITQSFTAIVQLLLVGRIFRLTPATRYLAVLVLFTVVVVLINLLSQQIPVNWIYGFLFMIAASVISALLLRLFHVNALLGILKKQESV